MKKRVNHAIFVLLLASLSCAIHAQERLYFASQPTITPDASRLFFCYDGGIWSVPTAGGTAARVTAMTGYQTNPRISPDGKWLAFSSNEQGNANVYVTPVNGGAIRQLTFHEAADNVSSWSADSKYVYFVSSRYNNGTTYRVSIDGGTPERLFDGYFNTVINLVQSPTDGTFYFNESNEASGYPWRKGYKGDNNPDIKSWQPTEKVYKQLTTYRGKDLWPTIDRNGKLYWASDQKNGEYNLACMDNGTVKILTDFSSGIGQPEVSSNGEKVVFTKDYMIHVYDVSSGKTTAPQIKVYENDRLDIAFLNNTDGRITALDASEDGKKLAFVSRGRLFVSDTKGLFVREIPTDPKERVIEVLWAKDNQSVYYTRTRKGWYNLYRIAVDKPAAEKAIYTPDLMVKGLERSHNRSMIAFVNGSESLNVLNCATDKIEKLADAEFWSFQNYSINFSPDDRYVAFTAMNLFDEDIYVYDRQTKTLVNLTNSASTEDSPAWSSDGKYMYLVANRYAASFPRGAQTNLYRIKLDYTDTPFKTEQYDKLFKSDTTKTAFQSSINTTDIQRRWEPILTSGSQSAVQTYKTGTKNYLVYASNHEGARAMYVQELLDFDQKPAKKITGLASPSALSFTGKTLYALQSGSVYSVDLGGASTKKIDIKQGFAQNARHEFEQMYYEVWALLSANFYDAKLHGVNWTAKRDYYAQFLPYVRSRNDFRTMVNHLLGELNSSHLGFRSTGNEELRATNMRSMATGLIFDNQQPYKVIGTLKGSPAYTTEQKIQPGDVLTAVNGKPVDTKINREYYFSSPDFGQEIHLTFNRNGQSHEAVLHTISAGQLSPIYYTQWEDDCRDRVNRLTNGRVAYHHMRDMSADALNKFLIDMNTDAVHKDALILDLRYNNGGNVHNEVLEYLSRKQHFTWKYRDKQRNTHPNVTPGDKPIVVLINERSLSDAEVTSNGIRTLGIGKLIGTETYRWIIFTSGSTLVDGSYCRLPAWGCYNLKGEDMESVGVAPDIYIKNTFEDRLLNKDPQLEKAISTILAELGGAK